MKNFKITKQDKFLLAGFVASCVLLVFLSWSLNAPIEHLR